MKNFQEIAEKIINKAISGTFILRNGNKISSKYLERNLGFTKYPYLLDETSYTADGIYYTGFSSDLDVIDFIPDTKYLNHIESALVLTHCMIEPQYFKNEYGTVYKLVGKEENLYVFENMHNGSIVYKTAYQASKLISTDSILENVLNHMKENELTIEIPDNKIVDWDESKKQNKIVLKDKQLTYEDICEKLFKSNGYYYMCGDGEIVNSFYTDRFLSDANNAAYKQQLECLLAKNKLANVAKYLNDGWKPEEEELYYYLDIDLSAHIIVDQSPFYTGANRILFKSEKLAQQAIEILGEKTIKLALEPLGI